ncbi:MAG: hypothetical protein GX763_01515, partial [Clostridiaceae bacterium]|nr:hypothetical protein [Clostridiaceae bacterium]
MLRARSRKLSLVLVLAMLMTMFAGLGTASAATGYSASHVPLVEAGKTANLGAIIVSFDNLPTSARPDKGFIVKLPASFKLADNSFGGTVVTGPDAFYVYVVDISAGVITGK